MKLGLMMGLGMVKKGHGDGGDIEEKGGCFA